MLFAVSRCLASREPSRSNEQGWALLGLLLALGVMSIVLTSAVVPNVQMQVQRDKEAEMLYRGEQVAQGIARYYGRGSLSPLRIQLLLTSPYGPLTNLAKLREGVTLGVREIKFVRPSAMIDPMNSSDWEPIRVRDPRIMKFLQAWLVDSQTVDTSAYRDYFEIAAPPRKGAFDPDPSPQTPAPGRMVPGQPTPQNPANPGSPPVRPPGQTTDEDEEEDEEDEVTDPLARLFESGSGGLTNAPIVGVAPKKKGKSTKSYFGLDNYEDWIFIYIPKNIPARPTRVSQ